MICCCLTDKESGFCRGLSREGLKRIRGELGWRGKLVMLIESGATGEDGTSHDELCTPAGLKRIAEVLEGVGPPIGRIVTWNSTGVATVTALVKDAHAAGLVVHPYTVRSDALPKPCPSIAALHAALFRDAGIDGVFTDFTDVTRAWLGR